MGYLLAEPVMPVFCSDICSSTDSHVENLQWCIDRQNLSYRESAASSTGTASPFRKTRWRTYGKTLLPLPPENSSVSPSIDLMSKTCSGVPISTVFCAENFSGVSTSTASPAGSCTGVFYRNRISCRKAARASRAGRLKWPIHWLSWYCWKVSVAYVLTQPFQSESFSGVPNGTESCLRAGVAYRLAKTLLSEMCSGLGQTKCFSAGT